MWVLHVHVGMYVLSDNIRAGSNVKATVGVIFDDKPEIYILMVWVTAEHAQKPTGRPFTRITAKLGWLSCRNKRGSILALTLYVNEKDLNGMDAGRNI